MTYEIIYYLAIFLFTIFLPFFIMQEVNYLIRIFRIIPAVTLTILYLIAAIRNDGIDFSNYYSDYIGIKTIPDKGYQFIVDISRFFELPYSAFLFIIGCITIYAIYRISTFYQVSYVLCLILFLSHSAVVRDFSQMRIGLAISLFMIGLTSRALLEKWIFYIFSVLVHLTSLLGILFYESCCYIANLKNKSYRITLLLTLSIFIFSIGQFPEVFSFIDNRVDIYLNWHTSGYGLPVDGFTPLYLHVSTLLIYIFLNKQLNFEKLELRPIVYLEFFGIITFIAFGGFAIFAYRFTNVITCLYFVLIAKSLTVAYSSKNICHTKRWISLVIGYCVIAFLLMRPGTSEILSSIHFGLF